MRQSHHFATSLHKTSDCMKDTFTLAHLQLGYRLPVQSLNANSAELRCALSGRDNGGALIRRPELMVVNVCAHAGLEWLRCQKLPLWQFVRFVRSMTHTFKASK